MAHRFSGPMCFCGPVRSTSAGSSCSTGSKITRTAKKRCFSRRRVLGRRPSFPCRRRSLDAACPGFLFPPPWSPRDRSSITGQRVSPAGIFARSDAKLKSIANRSPDSLTSESAITMSPALRSCRNPPANPAETTQSRPSCDQKVRRLGHAFLADAGGDDDPP